jgi:urea transport system substrate-binding protein
LFGGALLALAALPLSAARAETVKIGVLHSLSGTMAISETSLRDVVLMATEEINAAGGVKVGGKSYTIEPVVVDPASNWPLFAEKAKQLIVNDKVAATFGCWTSVSRKSCLPVFEAKYTSEENPYGGGLLFYPVQYEGEEQSPNIFYTGASPNEQLIPAAEYMMGKEGGSKKKFYLLGTDYVFPRTANKVLRAFLKAKGVPDANIGEQYTPFGYSDYQTIVGQVKEFAKDGNACVLSTINGDSNVPFYKEFANQGLTSDKCPVMAFSVAEDELRSMETEKLVGHLAAWNYFQSQTNPENAKFVAAFKAYCKSHKLPGGDDRVTDDPIEAAYFGVYVWKNAVEKAGSFEISKVIPAVLGQKFDAPGGAKKMDELNHHTWKPVLIGSIRPDGQFDIISKTPLVHPDSFSTYLHSPAEIKTLTGAK